MFYFFFNNILQTLFICTKILPVLCCLYGIWFFSWQIHNTSLLLRHWSIDFLYIYLSTELLRNYIHVRTFEMYFLNIIFRNQFFLKYQRIYQSILETYFRKTVYCLSTKSQDGISPYSELNGGWKLTGKWDFIGISSDYSVEWMTGTF